MVLDTTRDVVRKGLLAMLGAITLADDELEQLLDRLATRGEQVARDRLSHVEAVRNRLMGNQSMTRDVGHEGRILQQTLQEEIERRGRLFAAALDLPTRDSIHLLHERVDQISRALDQILAARTPLAAPTGDGHASVAGSVGVSAPEAPAGSGSAAPVEPEESGASGAVVAEAPVESSVAASCEPGVEEPATVIAAAPVEIAVAAPVETEAAGGGESPAASGGAAPVPGYDALNAKQAAALVDDLDEATLLALREYEQAHRSRVTVLRAIELALAQRHAPSA